MIVRKRFVLSILAVALGLGAQVQTVQAVTPPPEQDQMRVTKLKPSPVVVYDKTVTEGPSTPPLIWGSVTIPPSGSMASFSSSLKGVTALVEPPFEVPKPGQSFIEVTTPFGKRILSDLIFGFQFLGAAGTAVAFFSDENPLFPLLASQLPALASKVTFLAETGKLQDITKPLGLNSSGYKIEVSSGITVPVPEPANYAYMLAGIAVVGLIAQRKKA